MTDATPLTEAAEQLIPLLSKLPPADRLALAHYLYDSIDEEETLTEEQIRAEWAAELNRRISETEMGIDLGIPAEEVHRMVRESLSPTKEEIEHEWKAEILKRVGEIKSGMIAPVPIEEMFQRSREKYP